MAAYRSALEVRTRADLPQDWGTTQNNLGAALKFLGQHSGAEEGRKLLEDVVAAAYRSALEVKDQGRSASGLGPDPVQSGDRALNAWRSVERRGVPETATRRGITESCG
jgi:hypothetical protein